MVVRLILLLLFIWLVVTAYRMFRSRKSSSVVKQKNSEQMLQCAYCHLHIPASKAIIAGDHTYCSKAHQQADKT